MWFENKLVSPLLDHDHFRSWPFFYIFLYSDRLFFFLFFFLLFSLLYSKTPSLTRTCRPQAVELISSFGQNLTCLHLRGSRLSMDRHLPSVSMGLKHCF